MTDYPWAQDLFIAVRASQRYSRREHMRFGVDPYNLILALSTFLVLLHGAALAVGGWTAAEKERCSLSSKKMVKPNVEVQKKLKILGAYIFSHNVFNQQLRVWPTFGGEKHAKNNAWERCWLSAWRQQADPETFQKRGRWIVALVSLPLWELKDEQNTLKNNVNKHGDGDSKN